MKKFLITLLLLIAIGAAAFFFGWAQFSVPPGSYGVIISKTHGVDPEIVRSGEFRWVWYKLIPTNAQVSVFRIEPVKFQVDFNSSLPSGDSYASFAGLGEDFSWEMKGEISFSLDPQALVSVVSEYNLTGQEDLDAHLRDVAHNIEVMILRVLSSAETDSLRLERILAGNPDKEMEKEVKDQFPQIRDFSFVIHSAKYPDFVLYRQVRLLYEEFLTKQREYVVAAFGRRAENHIEAQFHFNELERYGELLTKYPVLLEYLAMTRDNDNQ
jgi:hypothetical protein